jgi:hypothetical protein
MHNLRFPVLQCLTAVILLFVTVSASRASTQADAVLFAAKKVQDLIDQLADSRSINENELGIAWQTLNGAESRLPREFKDNVSGGGPPKGYIACHVKLANAGNSARLHSVQRAHQEAQDAIQCYANVLGIGSQQTEPTMNCPAVDFEALKMLPSSTYLARFDQERGAPAIILVGGLDPLSPVLDYNIRRELEKFLHVPEGLRGSLIRYIIKDNTRGLHLPNPFDIFSDVFKQHAFLCAAPEAHAKLEEALQGETTRLYTLQAKLKASRKVSPALQDELETAIKAQRILLDSIIYLRKAYVDNYNSLGPMEKDNYFTPQQMNFPPWAWKNTY